MAFAEFQESSPGVSMLRRSLERGRLGHAYLFAGDAPDGLEVVARTLAKALNCHTPPARGVSGLGLDSCDRCPNCRSIEANSHPDVQWVRPESKSRVIVRDQILELMQAVHLKPTSAEYKVGVIVAADRLNGTAANTFLKTLEEPPPKSVLILLTADSERILETIRSRCLRLNFIGSAPRQASLETLDWLHAFSQRAAAGDSGLWARYQLLGTLQTKLTETRARIEETLKADSPLERYTDLEPSVRDKWEDELAAAIEAEYRRQRTDLLIELQGWLRDVWLATLGAGAEMASLPALFAPAQALAQRITADTAVTNLQIWERTQRLLFSNVQESLALEVGLLQLKL